MKRLLRVLGIGLLLCGLVVLPAMAATGKNGPAGNSNVAHLYLYEKDASWNIVPGGAWGKLKYNLAGPTFDFVFNGHGLSPNTGYSLIYYADPWPGNGKTHSTGAVISSGTSNSYGDIHLAGSPDLNTDLPNWDDANSEPTSCGDPSMWPPFSGQYPCNAKIWLVLSDDYDAEAHSMTGWNPLQYLFEGNTITYSDTDD